MELRAGPLQPRECVTGLRVALEAWRKLGWNHVGDPRAPRAWGFLCFWQSEVIEMTETDTKTFSRHPRGAWRVPGAQHRLKSPSIIQERRSKRDNQVEDEDASTEGE